jgi:hypothetical protein
MHNTRPPYRRQVRRRKPKVYHFVAVDLTGGSPSIDIPALGQVLAATDLSAGAPVLGAPAFGQVHNLKSATTPGRHDLVAVDVAVGLPLVGADPVGEQPTPQPFRRRRITKEIRVFAFCARWRWRAYRSQGCEIAKAISFLSGKSKTDSARHSRNKLFTADLLAIARANAPSKNRPLDTSASTGRLFCPVNASRVAP